MKAGRKVLLWAPRNLLILFALFLVIFSFDVFEEGKGAMEIGVGFVLYNIPSLIVGLVVFAAWRREWIGVVACLVLAVAYPPLKRSDAGWRPLAQCGHLEV